MRGRAKRDILSCKHTLPTCSTCKRVIKILFCAHELPCTPCTSMAQDILSCAHALPLYFTCKRAIRHILSFTHALWLYNLRLTLLTSKPIWWYWRRAVCAWIWNRAMFCVILHISDPYLKIAYGKAPSITSSTTAVLTTYTLISALLWTSTETLPWWRCILFAEECQLWWVWFHCLLQNDDLRSGISQQCVLYEESSLQHWPY